MYYILIPLDYDIFIFLNNLIFSKLFFTIAIDEDMSIIILNFSFY